MFEKISSSDKVEDIIFGTFNLRLPVAGGWGYSKENAVQITSNEIEIEQLQCMFVTALSTIEMSLTLPKESRYGGINVKKISVEKFDQFEKTTFEITAMLETVYADFIKEYKENHGKKEFNLQEHFKRREQNTLKRVEEIWFKL